MLRKIILILFIFILINKIYSQQKYSLQEAVVLAIMNSKEIKIADSKVKSSLAKIDEINSQLFPQLKLSANYTRLSDVPPFEITMPYSPAPIKISEVILNNYTVKVSFQQILFSGFRISSQKTSAEYLSEATGSEFLKTKNETAYMVRNAFWSYYKTMLIKEITEQNIMRFESHLKQAVNFMNMGLLTKNDVLKLEVQLSNSKLKHIEALSNLEQTRMMFNKAIGLSLDSPSGIIADEIGTDELIPDTDKLLDEAIMNREEIAAAELRLKAGYENLDASKSGYFPNLYLSGGYNFSRPNQRYQPTEDKFYGTWEIGLTLGWDIWNWGYTNSQKVQSEQIINQSKDAIALMKENILLEVKQNLLQMKISKEKLEVCKITIQQAEENLRITKDKYSLQLATTTDLIDAENYLSQAKTDYSTSLIDYQLSKTKLEKSLGRKLY